MGKVSRFSGTGCRFYRQGACLYGEKLNPGLEEGWRCAVFTGWEEAYEDYIGRADNFNLEPAEAAKIWKVKFERLAREEWGCRDYRHDGSGELPGCVHLHECLCLKALPPCDGVCINFQPCGAEGKK